jgi:lysophospholipase L1-like esterase
MSSTSVTTSKKFLFSLLMFGVLLALLIAEILCRTATFYFEGHGLSVGELLAKSSEDNLKHQNFSNLRGLIKPSPINDMVYELKPNLNGKFMGVGYSSNSHGMRDKEYTIEKPDNTQRLLAIGDSVLFGWGVEQEHTYLNIIEDTLNQSGGLGTKKFEALNFGTPGYNTAMEIALLENKALKFSADLILLHVVNNDLEVPLFMMKPQNIFALNKSFLLNFISSNKPDLVRHSQKTSDSIIQEYRHLSGFEAFSQVLSKLAQIANERDIPVIIIHGMLNEIMSKRLRKFAKKNSFSLVDVKPFIDQIVIEQAISDNPKARAKALQISSTDSHPNALGNQAYARAVLDALSASR